MSDTSTPMPKAGYSLVIDAVFACFSLRLPLAASWIRIVGTELHFPYPCCRWLLPSQPGSAWFVAARS